MNVEHVLTVTYHKYHAALHFTSCLPWHHPVATRNCSEESSSSFQNVIESLSEDLIS